MTYGGYPASGAPVGGPYGPSTGPPPNYLVWAILSTILCCTPLGIVSIVFAAQVESKWSAGDHAGAQHASDNARRWALAASVSMVAVYAVLGIVGLVAWTTSPAP